MDFGAASAGSRAAKRVYGGLESCEVAKMRGEREVQGGIDHTLSAPRDPLFAGLLLTPQH
jgi:hypothetical protein